MEREREREREGTGGGGAGGERERNYDSRETRQSSPFRKERHTHTRMHARTHPNKTTHTHTHTHTKQRKSKGGGGGVSENPYSSLGFPSALPPPPPPPHFFSPLAAKEPIERNAPHSLHLPLPLFTAPLSGGKLLSVETQQRSFESIKWCLTWKSQHNWFVQLADGVVHVPLASLADRKFVLLECRAPFHRLPPSPRRAWRAGRRNVQFVVHFLSLSVCQFLFVFCLSVLEF